MRRSRTLFVRTFITIVLVSMATVAIALPRTAQADSSSALDGVGYSTTCQDGNYCAAQLFNTTQSDDVVVLIVESKSNSTSVIDSSGLSFALRLSYVSTTDGLRLWEYYAVASSPLSNDNVTVVEQCCFAKDGMQVLAVHGADTNAIFDSNPSVPATVSCPGPNCGNCYASWMNPGMCSASIHTSALDFVIASTAINDAGRCGTSSSPPPGFTNISPGNGTFNGEFEVDYAVSNPQTNVAFKCSGTDAMAIVLDAIALSSPTNAGTYTLSWQGYDWDGLGEENLTLNGQLLASLPTVDSPQNGGTWTPFLLDITSLVTSGTNTLTFTHANWDCNTSDSVMTLQVTNGSTAVYSNSTSRPLTCTQSLIYTFTV